MRDAIEILKEEMNNYPNYRVYFTLKEMKLKYIKTVTVEYVKACLALHCYNIPITTALIREILNKKVALVTLHNLGDKHVLTLKRGTKGSASQWIVSDVFIKKYMREE